MKAAGALARRDDDVGALKADVQLIKWMMGSLLAMQVAILFKLFTH